MRPCAAIGVAGLALLLDTRSSWAQGGAPVQLVWQAPANCPQEAQVRQKLRDLLGNSATNAAPSRLWAEGRIDPVGERFRLTLNIHYDLVNGKRVVQANSCEDLGGVAAVTLALLFRAEHSSNVPLTASDLGESSPASATDARAAGSAAQAGAAASRTAATGDPGSDADSRTQDASRPDPKPEPQVEPSAERGAGKTKWRFVLRAPELRTDIGVLPEASYGMGFGAGARRDVWRFLVSGTFFFAQDYEPGPFVGYGAHFGRMSGELSVCRGFRFTGWELSPCVLLSLDSVSATGTGVGVSSTNPRTAWLSLGAGVQGLWFLGRHAALVFGINGRLATSRPRFVSASVGEGEGEVAQVGPAALGALLGCEWLL